MPHFVPRARRYQAQGASPGLASRSRPGQGLIARGQAVTGDAPFYLRMARFYVPAACRRFEKASLRVSKAARCATYPASEALPGPTRVEFKRL